MPEGGLPAVAGGALYIVPTPIGNLGDISRRAAGILAQADLVAAEDTRRTLGLLSHLGIRKPVLSYFEGNRARRIPELVSAIRGGKSVALVSDAGTPAVSDPGSQLVAACVEAGLRVIPIPGPSAVTCAVSAAGLPGDGFVFVGFLPRTRGRAARLIAKAAALDSPIVAFEGPGRLSKTLALLHEKWPEARVVVAREISKMHEEFLRGRPGEVLAAWGTRPEIGDSPRRKGEVTLVMKI